MFWRTTECHWRIRVFLYSRKEENLINILIINELTLFTISYINYDRGKASAQDDVRSEMSEPIECSRQTTAVIADAGIGDLRAWRRQGQRNESLPDDRDGVRLYYGYVHFPFGIKTHQRLGATRLLGESD